MKKKRNFFQLLLLLVSFSSFSQFNSVIAAKIEETNDDANIFIQHFTRPGFEGLMGATNSNWTNSAKPLKAFKVELNISAAGAFIPKDQEKFIFDESEYKHIKIESGSNEIPTLMGNETNTRLKIVYEDDLHNQIKVLDFKAPDGIQANLNLPVNMVPAPNIQVSVGIPLGFEAGIRYLPKMVSEEGGYMQLLGLGIKHSISQYFGKKKNKDGKKVKRRFNMAIHASYQNITAGFDDPDSDKEVIMNIKAISGNFLASYDFKLLSLYSSVGYTQGNSGLDVLGTYEYEYKIQDSTTGTVIGSETFTLNDPIDLNFNLSEIKAKLGLKLNLLIFSLYADYSIQKYPVANVGLGIKI